MTRAEAFMAKRQKAPELAGLFSSYQVNVPQLYADIDRTRAPSLAWRLTDVFDTMQIYLGSLYVNDFNRFGRTYSVRVQADAPFARAPRHRAAEVRSASGEMVPLAALCACIRARPSAPLRYNGSRRGHQRRAGARILVRQAQDAVDGSPPKHCHPASGSRWTDLTYQEILAGDSTLLVFPLAILLAFWCWLRV